MCIPRFQQISVFGIPFLPATEGSFRSFAIRTCCSGWNCSKQSLIMMHALNDVYWLMFLLTSCMVRWGYGRQDQEMWSFSLLPKYSRPGMTSYWIICRAMRGTGGSRKPSVRFWSIVCESILLYCGDCSWLRCSLLCGREKGDVEPNKDKGAMIFLPNCY